MVSQGSKTSTMFLFVLPALFSLLAFVDCLVPQDNWRPSMMVKRQFKVCGPQINQALSLLCEDHASPHPEDNSEEVQKRSFGMIKNVPDVGSIRISPYFFTKHAALSMLGNGHLSRVRRRDKIADECCYKGCTIDELTAYCAVERTNARSRFQV